MSTPDPAETPSAALRTEALEQLLTERGLIDPAVIDKLITNYETNVGPLNGAKVVARAWTDPAYRARLFEDGTGAIKELGFSGSQGEHIVVVENTATVHNVVVCTLCSCYPWPVLGLPPSWYKDPAYRARVVREPRQVLAEMGLELADDVQIVVHDSSSEVRWRRISSRWSVGDAMIGVAKVVAQ
jgi:nitrile hydratase